MRKLILLFVFLFSTNLFAQIPSYVPKNGLMGWWGFNGNANDESGNGNHGIFKNEVKVVKDRFNSEQHAISLDGNSSYVTTSLDKITSNSYTISCWFRTSNTKNSGIVVSRSGSKNVNGMFVSQGYIFNQVSSNCDSSFHYNQKAFSYIDSTWHHFVAVFDGDSEKNRQMLLYYDGTPHRDYTQDIEISICVSSPFEFGRDPLEGNYNYFKGEIDDIGIWDRALNSVEIAGLFKSNAATNITENNTTSQFLIYPNPTNSYVIIDCGDQSEVGAYSFSITNSLGQEKVSSKFTSRYQQIDISGIGGAGLYIISIRDGNNTVIETRKLLIQ